MLIPCPACFGDGCPACEGEDPKGFFYVDGTPADWVNSEISFAFRMHRHWKNGHRLTADCIGHEPVSLIEAIEHIDSMTSWVERDAMERAKQESEQAQAHSKAKGHR